MDPRGSRQELSLSAVQPPCRRAPGEQRSLPSPVQRRGEKVPGITTLSSSSRCHGTRGAGGPPRTQIRMRSLVMPRVLPPTQDSLSAQTRGGPLPACPDPGSPQFLGPHSPGHSASLTLCLHLLEPRGACWTFFIYRETLFHIHILYSACVYILYAILYVHILGVFIFIHMSSLQVCMCIYIVLFILICIHAYMYICIA